MNRIFPVLAGLLLVIPLSGWGHAPQLHGFRLTPFHKPFPAPVFQTANLSGEQVSLADFRGKVVLLNFWATWCPPCVREMPSMEKLYQAFRRRNFVVLAVALDQEGAGSVAPYLKRLGVNFPVLLDPGQKVGRLYGAGDLPSSFLIDEQGRVFAAAKGERDWFSREAQTYLAELLPPAEPPTGKPRPAQR